MVASVVEFRQLDFSYDQELVLENVNISIPSGDFAAIVGPNGGGKTTMLKLMLGLIKPNRGSVTLLGETPERSRTRIGYTPQHLQVDLQFPLSVLDVVMMGRLQHGGHWWLRRDDKIAATEALQTMRLFEKRNEPFRSLSGGQRQRVLIARAICGHPEILMLDEPTNNIDPNAEMILYDILQELNQRLTVLLVSHDVAVVSKMVKSVICVNRSVVLHPTSELTGTMVSELYGTDVRLIRHDHRCSDHGHLASNA